MGYSADLVFSNVTIDPENLPRVYQVLDKHGCVIPDAPADQPVSYDDLTPDQRIELSKQALIDFGFECRVVVIKSTGQCLYIIDEYLYDTIPHNLDGVLADLAPLFNDGWMHWIGEGFEIFSHIFASGQMSVKSVELPEYHDRCTTPFQSPSDVKYIF